MFGRQYLGDHAAERVSEQIDLGKVKRCNEARGIPCHLTYVIRSRAARLANADVVEDDDRAVLGESIHHRRVPGVHGPREMLQADQWYSDARTQPAVGKTYAGSLDELRGCG